MQHDHDRSPLERADDEILAGRAADGDTGAFAVLVRRHAPLMRAYARRILPGTAEVDDVVQEAFVIAWDQLPSLEEPARVKSWLMRITGRKAIDHVRAARDHVDIDDVDAPPAITSTSTTSTRRSRRRTHRNDRSRVWREWRRSARRCEAFPPNNDRPGYCERSAECPMTTSLKSLICLSPPCAVSWRERAKTSSYEWSHGDE